MPTRRILLSTALICAASATGCKQHYNGSLSMTGEDYAAVQAYHKKMAEREQRLVDREIQASGEHKANIKGQPGEPAYDGSADGQDDPQERSAAPLDPLAPMDLEEALIDQQRSEMRRPSVIVPDRREFVSTSEVAPDSGDAATEPSSKTSASPINVFGQLPAGDTDVSPMDSTGQIRKISTTEEGADFDVTTDATGNWLYFSSTRHRKTSDIYRQQVGGSAVTQLTNDPANDMMPCVSPDGRRIAFTSDRSGNWDIYLMDADGGRAIQLTSDLTHDIHPSFSPDGRHLVYCSYGQRSGQWQLVVIDVENPTTKRYIGHGLFPQWSPTQDTIVFQRARERGTRWFSVWTIDLDENGEASSPTEIAWSPNHACITPSWSPNGKHVVFCTVSDPDADRQSRPKVSDVWFVDSKGSGRTRLTQGQFSNLQPVWSASGSIYFVSNRGRKGVENIYALNPEDAVQLAGDSDEQETSPSVSVPTDTDRR